jgi:hypothetical protein
LAEFFRVFGEEEYIRSERKELRASSITVHNKQYNESCKGKAIPLQAWTGPEGSRRLRFPDFMTIGT